MSFGWLLRSADPPGKPLGRRCRGTPPRMASRRMANIRLTAVAMLVCVGLSAAVVVAALRLPAVIAVSAWGRQTAAASIGRLLAGSATFDGPLSGMLVAIDPGHGGPDRGACHLPSGLVEKEINLDMAFRLERALKANGAQVFLTRRDDSFLSLDERARRANERGADVFVSLHVNRYPSPECFGAQTFYLPESLEGRRLALLIQEELRNVYPPNYRQALPGNYRVLRGTAMPAALVEIGFVTNATDRALMQQDDYREAVAAAIVRGIVRFVQGETVAGALAEPGTGPPSGAAGSAPSGVAGEGWG